MARRDESRQTGESGFRGQSTDPARDGRTRYDYTGGSVDRPAPQAELRELVAGDVRFDDLSRQLYATDASAYEVTPIGVVYPTCTADVQAVVEYCHAREMGVLPRGGGTSLAGQSVNEAVVLDFTRYMNDVQEIDAERAQARAQPGVTLGDLNAALSAHGLKFAPDPAWGEKSALGGAIGNNSTGSHSLQYGKTDAYVDSCEVVLADGTVTRFGEVSVGKLRAGAAGETDISAAEQRVYDAVCSVLDERELVERSYPELKRNVSGYNLDQLVADAASGSVNLARLLAGSEGTLAIVTEATVSLEPIPAEKAVTLLRYDTVGDAMADVAPIVEHDPAAVEVLDDVLLELARDTEEFGALVGEMVPERTEAVLLVEFYADSVEAGHERVDRLLADRLPDGERTATDAPSHATSAIEAHDESERTRFWTLRKSGLPILLSRTSDAKHASFIEDVAVPPESLPEFVAEFQEILDEHDTFASFYGHAGPGCLHVRPLVNMKEQRGLDQMEAISEAVTDLAVKYGGSVSGEHGDGRARTEFNRKLYGQAVWELFRELKTAFDPEWILNPGQVCGYAADESLPEETPGRAVAVSMVENLRFSLEYDAEVDFEPTLNWDDNGVQGMVELCHGCGGCRGPQDTTGGVMCPTYRASEEESTSTRGRANALRQAISGDLSLSETDEEFAAEVMDLCIGCKGCAKNCPSEVDMAKLKAEFQHQQHEQSGPSLRDRLFAHVDTVSAVGSALAPLPSLVQRLPGSGLVTEKLLGIARERELPTFRRETLVDWAEDHEPGVTAESASRRVLLFPDTYTNYSHPEVGKAAVELLEAAGVHVRVADDVTASGRAAHSKGFLDTARERAETNVSVLAPKAATGWDIVVPEPSDAVMLQSDYLDLLSGEAVERVAANTYGFCEYLDRFRLDETLEFAPADTSLVYHGHCHQKAHSRDGHAAAALRRAGYDVDALDSGCCGMAGSFGYEAEHYSMSQSIAAILDDQIAESAGEVVVTPGASCRSQVAHRRDTEDPFDRRGDLPPHPIEVLAQSHSPSS